MNRALSLPLLLALAGCSSTDDTSNQVSMTEPMGHMDEHLSGLEAELGAHGHAVHAATELTAVGPLEDGHRMQAEMMLGEMEDLENLMHTCTDDGGASPDMEKMHAVTALLDQGSLNHEAAMAGAADLAAAGTEETRYQEEMAGLLAQMHDEMGMHEHHADTFHCDGAPHGH